jgi:hypothetical protein
VTDFSDSLNGQVTLTWTNPTEADMASISISWNGGGTDSVAKGTQSKTIEGLTNGTAYTFTLKAVDAAGNESAGVSVTATPVAPVNALNLTTLVTKPTKATAPVTTINAAQYMGSIVWKKGDDSSFSGNFGASTVYKAVITLTAKTGFTFTGVGANGFSYTNATSVTNAANSGTVTITFPATAALGTVSGITGTAGDRQVTLEWSNPTEADLASIEISWNGGTPIVTSGTTYTVTGLSNGTAYTFTLKAVDKAGNKSDGVQSSALTPLAPTGVVKVVFGGLPQDETINLDGGQDISWKANTALNVSASESFEAYRWVLDDATLGETGGSLTLKANELSVKRHKITVFVTKNGVEYAKILDFAVQP